MKEKELSLYKNLTKEQVELYRAMVATKVQVRLVNVCILVIFVLLGWAIYFLFYGKIAEAGMCFATDTAFGIISHYVYTHYFPKGHK